MKTQIAKSTYPTARSENLSITTVGDETVVYDQLTHNASCLNAVTTAVWNACNGKSENADLLEALRRAGFQDASEETVWLAIEQLNQAGLLVVSEDGADQNNTGLNRREMLRSLGKGAVMAVPVVSTIAIQTAAVAVSCVDPATCSSYGECCSKVCTGVGVCLPFSFIP